MTDQELQNKISAVLYAQIEGENNGLPSDEYDLEAKMFLEKADLETINVQKAASLLCQIFSETYGEEYSEDMFKPAAEEVIKLL